MYGLKFKLNNSLIQIIYTEVIETKPTCIFIVCSILWSSGWAIALLNAQCVCTKFNSVFYAGDTYMPFSQSSL